MTWLCCTLFMSFIGLSMQLKGNLWLEADPRYIRAQGNTTVTFTCSLRDDLGETVPLAACGIANPVNGEHFSWEKGTNSTSIKSTNSVRDESLGPRNHQDLYSGKCTFTLDVHALIWKILVCRVRPDLGGTWKYATMGIEVNDHAPGPYTLQQSEVMLVQRGKDVALVGQAQGPVDKCGFILPPDYNYIILNSSYTSESTTKYRAWLDGKQCRLTLLNVQPEDSGIVMSHGSFLNSGFGDFVKMIVSMPPVSPPLLSVNYSGKTFRAGDTLLATCEVGQSRPVSNINWLLDGNVIRDDNWNEVPVESSWRFDFSPQPMLQRIGAFLSQQDDGKELKCRARHVGLRSGFIDSNSHIIRFGDKSRAGA